MFEVCEGLRLGHWAPGPLLEQLLHVLLDSCRAELVTCFSDDVKTVAVVMFDVFDTSTHVGEGVAVSGQCLLDPLEVLHAIETCEEIVERVVGGCHA